VGAAAQREPRPEYRVFVEFGAAPDRLDELVRVVFAEIDSLKARGPREAELEKVREMHRREREIRLRENDWWMNQLLSYVRHGWSLEQIGSSPLSSTFTPEDVRQAAHRFLDPARYVQVSLIPERIVPEPASVGRTP
jgi:zinc protease